MVSEIDPDLWELLAVKIVHGKGKRCFAVVLSTGNGWIQVKIVDDGSGGPGEWARRETLAKRSHELQACNNLPWLYFCIDLGCMIFTSCDCSAIGARPETRCQAPEGSSSESHNHIEPAL